MTVFSLRNEFLEIKSSSGDSHLGGEDFNKRIVEYCIEKFKKTHDIDLSTNQKALIRLQEECEKQKRNLSSDFSLIVEVYSIADGEDLCIELNRTLFDEICKDLFKKCII